jgi:hypothetical protein
MTKRWILAALVGVGLAGWIAWSLMARGGDATRPTPPGPAAADSPAALPAPSPAIPETRAATSRATAIQPQRFDEPGPAAPKQAATGGKTLTVLLAPEKTPASGAIVDFNGFDTDEDLDANWEKLDASKTVQLVADGNGVVRLPEFKLGAIVRGRSGGRRGQKLLFFGQQPAPLLLQAAIGVLVTDAAGAPQPDVPVVIVDRDYPMFPAERGVTGRDGMAALVPPQTPMQEKKGRAPKLSVALALPLPEPVETFFDPMNPPAAPLQLILPPCGRVVVRLKRADGSPFLDAAVVRIHPVRDRQRPVFENQAVDELTVAADGGAAPFPLAPLAGNLVVSAIPLNLGLRRPETTVPGPRIAGADTPVELTCGNLATLVTGRVVDTAGQCVTRGLVDARIQSQDANELSLMFQPLDREGRFKLRFEVDPATITAKEIHLGVMRAPPLGVGVYEHKPETLTKALPAGIASGSVDLGDVVLPGAKLLASGAVVDQDGSPIGMAQIQMMQRRLFGWDRAETESVTASAADGAFELRGKAKGKAAGLIASRSGWVCVDPVPFEPGATGIRIVMTKAGGIEGSIKGLGERSWSRYSGDAPFTIVVAGKKAWIPARNESGEKDYVLSVFDGAFNAHDLLPETYAIRFLGKGGEELLVVSDVAVKAGEINRDPRLQDVDVSAFLASRTVTVVDEADKPIENARVAATEEDSNDFTTVETGSDGKALVTSRGKTVEVVVARAGYRAVKLGRVTGDVKATLKKSAPTAVTIRLDDSFTTPPEVAAISVNMLWLCGPDERRPEKAAWDDPRTDHAQQGTFGADRTARVQVQNPGVYEVDLWWSSGGISLGGGGVVEQKGAKATVTVPEDGTPPTVTVTPDAAALKRSLDAREKRKE